MLKSGNSSIFGFFFGLVVFCVAFAVAPTFAQAGIGKVKTLGGAATIQRGGENIAVQFGIEIEEGDVVETAKDGTIGLLMNDDTALSLGPNSRLTFDKYVYDPNASGGSFLSKLWRGTLGFISGKIGRDTPENVKVDTPLATIGIRGTEFFVSIDDPSMSK